MEILNTNVTINVSEMECSISFYQSIGFTLKQQWGNHYAQLNAPGIEIGLHPSEQTSEGRSGISIGFTTPNFEAAKEKLTQLNIPFTERKEEGGNFIHFSDPDGTSLYFIQPKW